MNYTIKNGEFPGKLKISEVTFLYKKEGPLKEGKY